jgi:CubicO group peptidase (beta-lactamase class C family)
LEALMATPSLSRTIAELERGIAAGWHIGAQLYASVQGVTVADIAVGEARPGVAMTTQTIVEWASATKPVTCAALALLWECGLLDLDDPVCRHLPEFAAHGKEVVTLRHLLTHTAGLADTVPEFVLFDEAVAAVCAAPLLPGWVPGPAARTTQLRCGRWRASWCG